MQEEGLDPRARKWLSLDAGELARATGGSWSVPMWRGWRFRGFSLSSRRFRPGDLIIQSDGDDAFTYGWTEREIVGSRIYPGGVLAKRGSEVHDASIPRLEVDSIQGALAQLAGHTLPQFGGVQIAVTGSVGKTTTCKMLEAVLSESGACLINGQQNLISGVLAAVASLTFQDFAVLEVAASAIPKSVPLLKPDICVITHIANAHTQQFGDLSGVAERKGHLLRSQEAGSLAVLNRDMPHYDDILAIARERKLEVITYGRSESSDYRLIGYDLASGQVRVEISGREYRYSLRNRGEHIAVNALAVLAVCDHIGIKKDVVARGLRSARPVPGRGDEHFLKNAETGRVIRLINSAYNANETSVTASLERLSEEPAAQTARRIAVLGDMLELGAETKTAHRRVVQAVIESTIDATIFVGQNFEQILGPIQSDQILRVRSPEEAARALHRLVSDGDTVLVQASNGTGLHMIPSILRDPPFNWERDRIRTGSLGPAWAVAGPDGVASWCGERRINPGRLVRCSLGRGRSRLRNCDDRCLAQAQWPTHRGERLDRYSKRSRHRRTSLGWAGYRARGSAGHVFDDRRRSRNRSRPESFDSDRFSRPGTPSC
jgi:UDP-N-acetylmuramoyl-tripeptide--D-alanyl-D-alanine ligase